VLKAWERADRTRVARNIGHMLAEIRTDGDQGDDEPQDNRRLAPGREIRRWGHEVTRPLEASPAAIPAALVEHPARAKPSRSRPINQSAKVEGLALVAM
jgi:hypothetical protein